MLYKMPECPYCESKNVEVSVLVKTIEDAQKDQANPEAVVIETCPDCFSLISRTVYGVSMQKLLDLG